MPGSRDFQFNGVVRLTRIGAGYVILTVIVGFASINTGNNSLYIGLSFMLGCLVLSGLASKGGLKHMQIEFGGVDEAWAGRPAQGLLRVRNDSPIWNVSDLVIVSGDLCEPIFVPIVSRKTTLEIGARFQFARRGLARLTQVDLYTRYPFGLFLKKRRLRINAELIVFPRLLDGQRELDRFRPAEGEQGTANRPGPGTDVYAFREYAPGDSLRHVHWKKSASTGRWIMKQTEAEATPVVHAIVDAWLPPSVPIDDFEVMISEAATFVHDALARELEVVLTTSRVTVRGRAGQAAGAMFRTLALLEPSREPLALQIGRDSVLFTVRRIHESQSA